MFDFLKIKKKNKKPKDEFDKENKSPSPKKIETTKISPIQPELNSSQITSSFTEVTTNIQDELDNTFNLSIELPKKFVHTNDTFIDNYISTITASASSLPTSKIDEPFRIKRKSLKEYHFETPDIKYLNLQRRMRNLAVNNSGSSVNDLCKSCDIHIKSKLPEKPPRYIYSNLKADLNNTPLRYPRSHKKIEIKQNLVPRYSRSAPRFRSTSSSRDRDDPIYLSKFAGGYEPSPNEPKKIESLEWLSYDFINKSSEMNSSQNINEESFTNNFSSIKSRSKSVDSNEKFKYQNSIFDDDYNDYVLKFRRENLRKKSRNNSCDTRIDSEIENLNHDLNEIKKLKEKIKSEIDEISKFENKSSMAAELLPEIKNYEKELFDKKDLDPWKASRSRNANIEPSIRTRYRCPINASPSRICRVNCASTSSSSPFFKRSNKKTSTCRLMASRSTLTESGSENVFHDDSEQEIKITNFNIWDQNENKLENSSFVQFGSIKTVPKPGYGLYNSTNQSVKPIMTPYYVPLYENINKINIPNYFDTKSVYQYKENEKNDLENSKTDKSLLSKNMDTSISTTIQKHIIYPYELIRTDRKKLYPKGIDRENLQKHLSNEEFHKVFGMPADLFYQLPYWRQTELKKIFKLF